MSFQKFVKDNRHAIDCVINDYLHGTTRPEPLPKRNDNDRKEFVLNMEGLYNWARREGVKI